MSLRIVVDIDGVLFDWDASARELLAHHRNVSVPPFEHWDFVQDHVSHEDWRFLWNEGIELGLFRNKAPYPNAQKGVERLQQLGHVAFVTSRPYSACRDTFSWLSRYFDARECHILNGSLKSSVLPQANVYIDDSPQVIGDLIENTDSPIVVFHREWNRNVPETDRVVRAHGWEEVVQVVSALV